MEPTLNSYKLAKVIRILSKHHIFSYKISNRQISATCFCHHGLNFSYSERNFHVDTHDNICLDKFCIVYDTDEIKKTKCPNECDLEKLLDDFTNNINFSNNFKTMSLL